MHPVRYDTYYRGNEMSDVGHLVVGALSVLFIAAVIFGLIVVISKYARSQGYGTGPQQPQEPIDIAKSRYAKGEITKEEFEQLKKDLSA